MFVLIDPPSLFIWLAWGLTEYLVTHDSNYILWGFILAF